MAGPGMEQGYFTPSDQAGAQPTNFGNSFDQFTPTYTARNAARNSSDCGCLPNTTIENCTPDMTVSDCNGDLYVTINPLAKHCPDVQRQAQAQSQNYWNDGFTPAPFQPQDDSMQYGPQSNPNVDYRSFQNYMSPPQPVEYMCPPPPPQHHSFLAGLLPFAGGVALGELLGHRRMGVGIGLGFPGYGRYGFGPTSYMSGGFCNPMPVNPYQSFNSYSNVAYMGNGYNPGYMGNGYNPGYMANGYNPGYMANGYNPGYMTNGYNPGYMPNRPMYSC